MMESKVNTIAENVDNREKFSADLDQALAVAGIGWYNIKYSLALSLFLIAAIIEPVGYSYILPAALCDLQMTSTQRGFIASVPYIGLVVTSFPWGYLVDTKGRKYTIIISSLVAGGFSILSGFMPELISFTACKFLTSLWYLPIRLATSILVVTIFDVSFVSIACPAAVPYTYIGEILPQKYRDVTLSVTNALQITGSALVPLLAWGIIPLDFRIDFGAYVFRSWRLLTIVYALFFILAAFLLSFGPESPKYLVSQGKHDEAMRVLQTIYAKNKGKSPEEYPIKRLTMNIQKQKGSFVNSLQVQTVPLLRAPYLKWLALLGFLHFGIFSVLNGLYIWVPDVLNQVLTGSGQGLTACDVIAQRLNGTADENAECVDTIDSITFTINSIANITCAVLAVAISSTVKIIGKKTLLIGAYFVIGIFCILINFMTNDIIFAVLLSSFPIMGLGIGPVNAFAVEIFPTHLRGMAVGLAMMIGRTGSIIGTNVAGILLNAACEVTFYSFGGLLLFCGVLSFLLPQSGQPNPKKIKIISTRL